MKLQLPTLPTRPARQPAPKTSSAPRPNKPVDRLRAWLKRPPPSFARPALTLAVVVALLGLVLWGLIATAGGAEMRVVEQHRSDADTTGLAASSIAQSFVSPRANLSQVEIELGSYTGLPRDGQVRLLEGDGLDGQVMYVAPLSAARFDKNPLLTIAFPPVAGSRGVTYTLVLETPGRPLGSAVGVKYSTYDTLSSGQMYLDGEPADGDLALSAYYHYGAGTLWDDLFDALGRHALLVFAWLCLLLLPGLALLLWLPNGLSTGQRLLAAPALSILALPVLLLLLKALNMRLGTATAWVLLVICAGAVAYSLIRTRQHAGKITFRLQRADAVFWAALGGVLLLTVSSRLLSLRDASAGMGLDAYHHTLIASLFVERGGIPADYLPYAPLASFTYHFGFHSVAAAVAWLAGLAGLNSPESMLTLMPQAGQLGTALPVLTLTLFAWRVLGNRWVGLAAGALVGLVSVFPAFYVNWSRYTQGLGLALLPVAWVLLLEVTSLKPALERSEGSQVSSQGSTNQVPEARPATNSWEAAARRSGPFMLAVIGAAGLALTHYRVAMIYAAFAVLYVLWATYTLLRQRKPAAEVIRPLQHTLAVAVLTVAALSPWLVNLSQNFGTRFVGKTSPVAEGYYSLENMIGLPLLLHPSWFLLLALALGGVVLVVRQREPVPLLLAATWLLLGVWSNPYLLPVRLPYAGYLDATTLATGAWLPLSLLAGYSVVWLGERILALGNTFGSLRRRVWRAGVGTAIALVVVLAGAGSALSLSAMIDSKPYVTRADLEALAWMRDNLAPNAYVLANPFAFPWDAPPQAIQGSDAGLWVPLLTGGVRSSVPPIPTYNERAAQPDYVDKLRDIISYEPFGERPADWASLKDAGITHVYVGSRGGALDVPTLLKGDHTRTVFHKDAVWVFELR